MMVCPSLGQVLTRGPLTSPDSSVDSVMSFLPEVVVPPPPKSSAWSKFAKVVPWTT